MKRVVLLTVACATLLLASLGASLLAWSYAHAIENSTPRIQMLSDTFVDENIANDGTKATLILLPFSVSSKSALQATSLMTASNFSGGTVTCELDVDSVSFFSIKTSVFNASENPASVGITSTTTGIAPGHHTFAVICSDTGSEVMKLYSQGTSVMIVG